MELQAKIELVKAFQKMPAGHGKFDFEKMWEYILFMICLLNKTLNVIINKSGKRFLDPMKNMDLYEINDK